MNITTVVSTILLLTACGSELSAQSHHTNQLSAVLNEFLHREGIRDPETGAILRVRPKGAGPIDGFPLDCTIRKLPGSNQVSRYEIVLTVLSMTSTETNERIVLDAEPALLVEVSRQARYRQLAPERERRLREARTKKIKEKTGNVLRYGMTREQVKAVKGDNWKPGEPYQKAGASEMRYEDMTLFFDSILVDVYPAGEPLLGEPAAKPVPLIGFDQRHNR